MATIENISYRAYSNYPGRAALARGRKAAPGGDVRPNIAIPIFSGKVTLVEVAARFRPAQERVLREELGSSGLLEAVQTNFLNVGKAGPEVRVIYIGGHLDACLNDELGALPILPGAGKRVEAFLPLDLIYLSREDFKDEPGSDAFDAKAAFLVEGKDGLHRRLAVLPQVDHALFFDGEMIEARGRGDIPVQLIVRIYSSTAEMLTYLRNA